MNNTSRSKPVDQLTIEDLKKYPIWTWAIEEERNVFQDETWVTPAKTTNFTEELNGSVVLGELTISDGEIFPAMFNLDLYTKEAIISSIVFYNEELNEYCALEDFVKELHFPLSVKLVLTIYNQKEELLFEVNRSDIYKNQITTHFRRLKNA
ncbi:hypothetical protein SFC65_19045 [Priestia filamentosa]|uniref:hypothetical protein n=1 Tax=Priestia filamentosa TaxID=1402861 RepID=UPI003982A290